MVPQDALEKLYPLVTGFGYAGLLALAFVLPFNVSYRVVGHLGPFLITDLAILILAVVLCAGATLLCNLLDRDPVRRTWMSSIVDTQRSGLVVGLLLALFITSIVSALSNGEFGEARTWLIGLPAGGLLCLAMPIWLAAAPERRMATIGKTFVAGAVVAAIIGLAEFVFGAGLETDLVVFRPGPTTVGPYLRLTGPFGYANEAALYFVLALPFSLNELVSKVRAPGVSWVTIVTWLAVTDILIIALLLTYSRGGIVAFTVSVLAMGLGARGRLRTLRAADVRRATPLLLNAAIIVGIFIVSTSSIDAMRLSGESVMGWYRVSFQPNGPSMMKPGETRLVKVRILNTSPLPWKVTKPRDYALGYHWLLPSWRVVRFDSPTTALKTSVLPGGNTVVQARVTAPYSAGLYVLVWDLLSHGTTWFAEKTGTYSDGVVRVTGQPASEAHLPDSPLEPDHYRPPRLPLAQTVGRIKIWSTALKMVVRQPFLGLGPYGFRMHYYAFNPQNPLRRAPAPATAHNVLLELTVDYGLIAVSLFVSLVLLLWRPIFRMAKVGDVKPGCQLAVLGAGAAMATQGMVDYSLGTLTILFAFWILCGLAAIEPRSELAKREPRVVTR